MNQTELPEEITQEIENFGRQIARLEGREIPEEKFKRFRLQNGVYGQRQKGVQMVRVKIPSGTLNSEKLRTLADIAEHYSTGKGHVTTRQDVQFHFVKLHDITAVLYRLAQSGLTTREACGNTVRNVTACHLAGICPTELFDVTPYAKMVASHLLRNPINQDLPRKFKISFSGCRSECGFATVHDIGFIATSRDLQGVAEYGFKVFVGGGLGSSPKLAKLYTDFLPCSELLPTCEAILKIFDAHGDRKTRSKARMKFIVEKWGIEQFKNKVSEERRLLKERGEIYPPVESPVPTVLKVLPSAGINGYSSPVPESGNAEYVRWFRTNVLPQREEGVCTVHVKLVVGDITALQLRGLADIVDRFSPGEICATHQQNFMLRRVRQEALPDLYVALEKYGLAGSGAERVVDVIACPGTDSCQLGLTSSMGLGEEIVAEFSKNLHDYEDIKGLRIRISGCPNSCAHHHIAGIGLHGVAKKISGKLVPHYQLHLGGVVSADRSVIGSSKLKLPAKNTPAAVMETIHLFRENRLGDEDFNQFVERYGRDAICHQLAKFTSIPSPEEAPEDYRDYKADKDFDLEDLGPGECAGTMIDLMENYLRRGPSSLEEAKWHLERRQYAESVSLIRNGIVVCCRALLIPFGVDSPHEEEILKEFQYKLVEQGFVSERFENFTEDLGKWAQMDLTEESMTDFLREADLFVCECTEAYDQLDANMKLRKRASPEKNGVTMSLEKKVDMRLDLSGVACPMNFVKTKLQLEEMDPGQLLEVVIDDGEPMRNVPKSVQGEGHKVLALTQTPSGHYKLVIEKV